MTELVKNDNFASPDFSTAARIKLSTEDPLAFDVGGEQILRELETIIIGGVPRYSAKDSANKWHNFATRDELDDFMTDHADAQRSQKYQIRLLLPSDDRQWLFDLPYTSSIAFWAYKESLEAQGLVMSGVVTKMSVERVKQKKDASLVFSRVKFAMAGDAPAAKELDF